MVISWLDISIIFKFEDIELQVQLISAMCNMLMKIEIKEKLGLDSPLQKMAIFISSCSMFSGQ